MAKKRRVATRRKTADPLGVLGGKREIIPVHDVKGPIYAVVLHQRGSSKARRGKKRGRLQDKPIIIITVGNGGRCVKHEFDEVVYYVCGGSES